MTQLHIRTACTAAANLSYLKLHGIQGALRIMSKERFEELKNELITQGFRFALSVWLSPVDGKIYIIDGHGRHAVVKYLVETEGYAVDPLPCVYVQAETYEEAKRLVLPAIASYQQTTEEGMYEYLTDLGISVEEASHYEIAGIDWDHYRTSFVDDPIISDSDGALELDRNTFTQFKQVCPKCGFSFDNNKKEDENAGK